MQNPYQKCPVFETENFILRLVRLEDTEDLLKCYSDVKARELFNADKCHTDFCFETADELRDYIASWLKAYEKEEFVRFAIVDRSLGTAAGTVEMFGKIGVYKSLDGVLRIDICSEYEKYPFLKELFTLAVKEFFPLFGPERIITKAIPIASERIKTISELNFCACDIPEREHSWVLARV